MTVEMFIDKQLARAERCFAQNNDFLDRLGDHCLNVAVKCDTLLRLNKRGEAAKVARDFGIYDCI